ncbi:hypothetical protein NECAME_06722 [Necator americanus]|uniref:Uncharacterized protein n=1 Tax=Necator americanus TaxID=51031 RepID=W2TSP4_NECAM|nr:hypothetical protein NECAME_06722 [Necator americanus]ETN84758.1 hypothetical protein NECAME_06722 [Necator americanus]
MLRLSMTLFLFTTASAFLFANRCSCGSYRTICFRFEACEEFWNVHDDTSTSQELSPELSKVP